MEITSLVEMQPYDTEWTARYRGIEYYMRLWRVFGYMSNIGVLRLTAVFRFIRAVIAVVFAVTEEYGCPHTETRVFTLKLTFSASCQNENTLTNQTPRFVLPTSV